MDYYALIRVSDVTLALGYSDTLIEWITYDEETETYSFTEEKDDRAEFDSLEEAEAVKGIIGDEYLAVIPLASKPLTPAAIASCEWLVSELTRLHS